MGETRRYTRGLFSEQRYGKYKRIRCFVCIRMDLVMSDQMIPLSSQDTIVTRTYAISRVESVQQLGRVIIQGQENLEGVSRSYTERQRVLTLTRPIDSGRRTSSETYGDS
jgi:hypothetical protein